MPDRAPFDTNSDGTNSVGTKSVGTTSAGTTPVDTVLSQLTQVLEQRKHSTATDSSYVAKLHQEGLNKILKKVGEECAETIIAAKDAALSGDNQPLIYETADLWFHTLVMLSHVGEDYRAVLSELERRFDLSGLAEKAARNP